MSTVAIPQLDPDAYPDPRPSPEICLLAAIVQMALRDLQSRQHQEEARAFVDGQELELYCEWIGWDAAAIR